VKPVLFVFTMTICCQETRRAISSAGRGLRVPGAFIGVKNGTLR
jgi:hypothetical protein